MTDEQPETKPESPGPASPGAETRRSMVRRVLIGVAVTIVGVVVLVVAGTWVYVNVFRDDAPAELTLDTTTTLEDGDGAAAPTTASGSGGAAGGDGTWTATSESIVGYRVDEILFGQNATAVGRTNDVTGSLTVDGSTVTATEFEADLTTVESDDSRRDNQFRGRIMDVAQFPTATFVLTTPIELGAEPATGEVISAEATGDLTLRGTTQPVTFPVEARVTGDTAEISGSIPIVFDEWGIPNPSFGPITTEDNGELEFLLVLAPA